MFTHKLSDTESLCLFEPRHAEELFTVVDRNRERLRRWFPWVDGSTEVEDTRKFIRGSLEAFASTGTFDAGILVDGRISGCIGHHAINWQSRKTEIGYWLSAEVEGRGLMTRACGAVVNHLITNLNLNRVIIHCATGNTRSRRVPEKLGFVCEGTLRQAEWLYDHFEDLAVYSMLKQDWTLSR